MSGWDYPNGYNLRTRPVRRPSWPKIILIMAWATLTAALVGHWF